MAPQGTWLINRRDAVTLQQRMAATLARSFMWKFIAKNHVIIMSNVVTDRIAALLIDIRKTHTQRIVAR